MPRRLVDPGPLNFSELRLPNARAHDLHVAQRVQEKFFPRAHLEFSLFRVPTIELIESSFVDAVIRKEIPAPVYESWRLRGGPEAELRALFNEADAAQRRDPGFAGELVQIQALEKIFAEQVATDPLIARSLEVPLSTGEEALFIIDGRHRLLAAAATSVAELEVYVGTPSAG